MGEGQWDTHCIHKQGLEMNTQILAYFHLKCQPASIVLLLLCYAMLCTCICVCVCGGDHVVGGHVEEQISFE